MHPEEYPPCKDGERITYKRLYTTMCLAVMYVIMQTHQVNAGCS